MYVEIHLIQNYALSNLNRDDAGAPKSCIFGGTRRARISSQCLKRAVRTYFREEALVPSEQMAYRTKRLHTELSSRLALRGTDMAVAEQLAGKALEQLNLKLKAGKTEYLLMLGDKEIDRMAEVCEQNASELLAVGEKKGKKEAESLLPRQLLSAIDGGDAVDIALFGRMIATHAQKNVDAAVQMAHAFSTHTVATEFDFFSAVDDIQPDDTDEGAGAGMLGTTMYNSSCYYRYANLDLNQLKNNLGQNPEHVVMAMRAFLEGTIYAIPSGKGTNSAPQNLPSLVMIVVRDKGLWSLANAFVQPVAAGKGDLIERSVHELMREWKGLAKLYGTDQLRYVGIATTLTAPSTARVTVEPTMAALLQQVMQAVQVA